MGWSGAKDEEHAMSQTSNTAIAVIGIDIGKNSFVGHGARGAIVPRQKWSRGAERGLVGRSSMGQSARLDIRPAVPSVFTRPGSQERS